MVWPSGERRYDDDDDDDDDSRRSLKNKPKLLYPGFFLLIG
jgi:hypothetical protein